MSWIHLFRSCWHVWGQRCNSNSWCNATSSLETCEGYVTDFLGWDTLFADQCAECRDAGGSAEDCIATSPQWRDVSPSVRFLVCLSEWCVKNCYLVHAICFLMLFIYIYIYIIICIVQAIFAWWCCVFLWFLPKAWKTRRVLASTRVHKQCVGLLHTNHLHVWKVFLWRRPDLHVICFI